MRKYRVELQWNREYQYTPVIGVEDDCFENAIAQIKNILSAKGLTIEDLVGLTVLPDETTREEV